MDPHSINQPTRQCTQTIKQYNLVTYVQVLTVCVNERELFFCLRFNRKVVISPINLGDIDGHYTEQKESHKKTQKRMKTRKSTKIIPQETIKDKNNRKYRKYHQSIIPCPPEIKSHPRFIQTLLPINQARKK